MDDKFIPIVTLIFSSISIVCSIVSILITYFDNDKLRKQNLELSKYKESERPTSFTIKNQDGKIHELFLQRYNDSSDEDWFLKIIDEKGDVIFDGVKKGKQFKTKLSAINSVAAGNIENVGKYKIIR